MRIAIVVDTFPSISETFISNKVQRLSARGHHIIVFCVRRNDRIYNQQFKSNSRVVIVLLNKQQLLLYILLHPLVVLGSSVKGDDVRQKILRKFRLYAIQKHLPDIIHFEFSSIGTDYLYEIKRLRGKKIFSCRGSAEKVKLLIYQERKEKFRELFDLVDAVHCVSKDMVNTIRPYCKDIEKIFINHPSIDPCFFQRRLNKTESTPSIILSVGRLTFQKGYTTALLAIKLLKETGISFLWKIVGYGNKYEEIVFKVRQLNLADEVMLLGSRTKEEVQSLMEQADVFFLPSVYEGIANVVLEAMAMQLPVVATKSGGMCEVIDHEKDGLLTDLYDYRSMASSLVRLCSDDGLRQCLGVNARKKVIERFNLDAQVTKFEEVYRELQLTKAATIDGKT